METDKYIDSYFNGVIKIAGSLDRQAMKKAVELLLETRNKDGRLFILGVGGSAANASHAVNDFRKLVGIESYTPTDNVSELTARINDDGWDTVFASWLKGSRLNLKDCVMVISVGGGNEEKNISVNLIKALNYAKEVGAKIIGLVGRDGGFTAKVADAAVLIPVINSNMVTPLTEAYHAVIWHMLVSHPALQANEAKWESVK
jgi:D-sedoheptulose 7-phosphate isomerase